MLTISKPLSASQVRTYHEREFASERQNYWSRDQQGHSEWQGKLAEQWSLSGAVGDEHFARLTEGQHPHTEVQLVRHQVSKTYEGKFGKEVTSVEHRAGWDATFSAPKSVSLTALVGGDERVREAHRESVRAALAELEKYTQARIGNVHAPETTGKFVAATFEHDTARPVDGYAAPQLHTHSVIFNVTERDNGQTLALQPQELFASQRYATSVYRSELSLRLQGLGYELERGKHGQPEIKGYTKEYLEASSPRREQIKDHLREMGLDGAGAAQVAAHRTRDSKELLSPGEVLERHRELAAQYGHQADKVVAGARAHEQRHVYEPDRIAQQAVTYARDHLFERSAVLDRRELLEAALSRGMGETTYAHIHQEFSQRAARGEFRTVDHAGAGQQYTTAAMLRMEREIIARMQERNQRGISDPMLVDGRIRVGTENRHPELNASQRQAVDQIFISRERMVGLDGVAGAGKTTTLAVIREGAEAQGYKVEGFAPTSRAAQKLADAGMETSTLQKHLVRGQQPDTGERRLYVLDESSLASTKQMHEFVNRLHPNDRVLLVGDRRQHEAVEAGRPFAQLQDAGMKTVKLEEIVRQKDPELKQVVEQLARGEVREAVQGLERQGRVHEIAGREERIAAIAKEYAKLPEGTLVVSPDNRYRVEINLAIRAEMQERSLVSKEEHRIGALVPRQDLTGPERTWAARYEFNDVVRYARASKETGMERGEYARVKSVDADKNLLTVVRADGSEQTYDPRRQQGVSVYREEPRNFAVGDRIQFTAPANDLKVANRELGTVEAINANGKMRLKMDGGRDVQLDAREHPHLDHGYAVTSHSSQGQTAERVLIHVDTELAAKDLLNSRMAYVAVSRGAEDAQLFTNDRTKLPEALGHDVSHESAHMPAIKLEQAIKSPQPEIAPRHEHSYGYGLEL
ncbi:relaxase domain-containing protein [Granulicella sp. 5B5]|uniref:MobF family relaxase n=1 Tax=Granulicella sp. 5B5 TaxID=1617967 RepID=UPI0015F6F57C|nr:MobF family relaxase [Granulicella sp. 5B5]QMV20106.1 relaxase domain-containing protein [Granulicella sp. 5B5]